MDQSTVHAGTDLLDAARSMDSPEVSSNGHLDASSASTVYLSVQQAAEHARVSTKTIRRMIRRGQLRADLVDGAYVIDREALGHALLAGPPSGQSMDRPASPRAERLDLSSVQPLLEAATRPLVERLASQAEEIGRLRVERQQAQERSRALAASREPPTRLGTTITATTDNAPHAVVQESAPIKRAWWRFW
jgi:excisionase family DNA binding protein